MRVLQPWPRFSGEAKLVQSKEAGFPLGRAPVSQILLQCNSQPSAKPLAFLTPVLPVYKGGMGKII